MAGYGSAFGGGRNRQFEVEVAFVQTREGKGWAQDGLSAEEEATEIVEGGVGALSGVWCIGGGGVILSVVRTPISLLMPPRL